MDAMSHHSGMDEDESNADALRRVAAGEPGTATAGAVPAVDDGEAAADSDDSDVEADLRRLFRM